MTDSKQLNLLCVNAIRTLSMDMVQQANSGHPGAPMGMAPMAYTLWTRFLKQNPQNPQWADRDRFVLSAGHASALLYSLLYLTGYDVSLDDLKRFRQWGSKTPGHPEYGVTPGVETTTGPLGQGFATAVGMALAERMLAQRFNRPEHTIVDHYTYVIAGDGDMMEGITSEAASLAGHLKLGKLICLYDANSITIEGKTDLTFSEDVCKRFEAYGWHVRHTENGDEVEVINAALESAQKETGKPSLIWAKTHIAHGSPNKQDSAEAHGSPLGVEEIRLTKRNYGWPEEPAFYVPDDMLAHFRHNIERGAYWETEWKKRFDDYAAAYPNLAQEWTLMMSGKLPEDLETLLPKFAPDKPIATRAASGQALNALAKAIPELVGGSADLAPSNNTYLKGFPDVNTNHFDGRNLHFGIREHAMGAIMNGMALHGGFIPYGGTFLIFSDYMRPAIRLAALMEQRVIYVFTHDSIGLGEDGPTHQPIEQLAALRAIPNLIVIRPADAAETAVAWKIALEHTDGPTALVLCRQNLPILDRSHYPTADALAKGAYILTDAATTPLQLILIATGSEIGLALQAHKELTEKGAAVRVVNMPSWELFDAQPQTYKDDIFPPDVKARIVVEAGSSQGWHKYVGENGIVIGIDHFGASAPAKILFEQFGFTVENIVAQAMTLLS